MFIPGRYPREPAYGAFSQPRYYPRYQSYINGPRNPGGVPGRPITRPTTDGYPTISPDDVVKINIDPRTLVAVAFEILALCLIGTAIFLGVYLSQSNASATPVNSQLFMSTLKIDDTFILAYNNLTDPATVELTKKLCSALQQILSFIYVTSSSAASWGNNCFAISYTNGSIVSLIQFSMKAASTANADDIMKAVESAITKATEASTNGGGPFFSIFNKPVVNQGITNVSPVSVTTTPSNAPVAVTTVASLITLSSASDGVTSTASPMLSSAQPASVASTPSAPPVTGTTVAPATTLSSASDGVTSTASGSTVSTASSSPFTGSTTSPASTLSSNSSDMTSTVGPTQPSTSSGSTVSTASSSTFTGSTTSPASTLSSNSSDVTSTVGPTQPSTSSGSTVSTASSSPFTGSTTSPASTLSTTSSDATSTGGTTPASTSSGSTVSTASISPFTGSTTSPASTPSSTTNGVTSTGGTTQFTISSATVTSNSSAVTNSTGF